MLPLCGQIEISRRKSSGDRLVCRRLNSTSRHSFEVYEKRKWGRARSQCFIASTPTQNWLNPDMGIEVCVFVELRRRRFAKVDQEYALLQIFRRYPIFFVFFCRRLFGRLRNSFRCFRPLFAYSTTCNSLSDSTSLEFLMRLKRKYQMLSSRVLFSSFFAVMTTTTSKLKLETLLFRHSEHKFFSCWPRRLLVVFLFANIYAQCCDRGDDVCATLGNKTNDTIAPQRTLTGDNDQQNAKNSLPCFIPLINDSYDFLQLFTTRIHVIQSRVQLR